MIGEAEVRSRETRTLSVFLSALTLGFLGLALVLLPLHFVSYAKAKALFDWYIAVPEETHNRLFGRLPIAAGVFGICGVTLAAFKQKLARFLLDIPSEWTGIRGALRGQFQGGTATALEIGAVFSVFILGTFMRVWHLGRAVRFDEAWTYVDFASRPLLIGLSNYQAPNNHLLNTLLVHFSTRLFGNTVFGLRFPTFVAGCLVILASWFVARSLYGPLAGILTAGCVAAMPTFTEFSVNARGYALQWLFILALMWFGLVLQENPSLRTGWLGFVFAGVAGMYSIPTTLIAVAGVFGWMLVSTLVDGEAGKFKSLLGKIALAGLAIGLLSILLYLPPLLDRGPGAVMAKEIVTWQQRGDFVEGFAHLGQCARARWTEGVPTAALWILFGGFVVGLVLHHWVCKHRVPMSVALWLSAAIIAMALHVFAFPRVWSYLLLSAVMTACAGLTFVLTFVAGRSQIRRVALASVASLALAVFIGAGVIKQGVLFTSNEGGTIIDAEQIADFLSTELRPGDCLVSNALVNYELLRRNPKLYGSLTKPENAARVLGVAIKITGSTELCSTEKVLALLAAQDTADPSTLSQQIDLNAYKPPEIRAKFLTSTVYSLERRGRTE